jgi:SNF2 family DNA or RNA helicase
MDKNIEALYKVYLKLPKAEQQVLQILSVMFEPRKHGTFLELVEELNWVDENNVPLSRYVAKRWRDKWLNLSLITYNKCQLQCHMWIVEALTWETIQNNSFDKILIAVKKFFPTDEKKKGYKLKLSRPYYQQAQIRIALYQKNEARLSTLLGVKNLAKNKPNKEKNHLLSNIAGRFLKTDPALFDCLSDHAKFYALAPLAMSMLYNPLMDTGAIECVEKYFPALIKHCDQAACVLAEVAIFRGCLVDASTLVEKYTTSQALALQGWIAFLQNDRELALQRYELALVERKKESRKGNVYLTGLAGVFYIITLLAVDSKKDREQALQYLRYHQKEEPENFYGKTFDQLDNTLEIYLGSRSLSDVYYLTNFHYSLEIVPRLLQTLQWLWVGYEVNGARRKQLIRDRDSAARFKLNWLVWQIEKVLEAISDDPLITMPLPAVDCIDLRFCITKREGWEIALEALEEITDGGMETTSTANNSRTIRMSWRIYDSSGIEPREQKLSKNGKWTQGRKVSLKKLYTERENYDYLTEQDQRICNHIQEHNYFDYGYSRSDYEVNQKKAILEAIGHPFLFLEKRLTKPIELIEEKPRLEVKEVAKGKSLKLQIIPYSEDDMIIYRESENRIAVVKFNQQHQHLAEILGKEGITVPKKAKQKVMERIAQLAPLMTIHSDIAVASTAIETVEAKQTLLFHLQPIDDGLRFNAYIQPFHTPQPLFHAGEGGATVFTEIDQKQVQTHRDLKAEKKKFNKVLRHCPALYQSTQQEWLLDDPELALETLLQLQELEDQVQLEWPQGKKITLNHAAAMSQMSLTVRKSQDWFALSGELQVSDKQVLEMRQLMTLLNDSSGRFIRLGDNQFLALTEELRDRLDAIRAYTSDKGHFHALAIPAIDELSEGMNLKASKPWKDQLARLQDSQKLKAKLPTTLQAELRDYQLEGFQWLVRLAHWGAGACLADDMGLGKTMQALALILSRCKQGPTLILAPTSVCNNWETETYRFAPTLKVKRFGTGDRQAMLDNAGAFDLIICSYGLLQSESERLIAVKWNTIVADEAQAIKNHQAKRTKAAVKLQADFKVVTTGTPIENHLGELWSLFQFINPGLLGSLDKFNQKYALPIERDNSPQARQQLKNLISPFILRRLKSTVLTELPSRTEITLKVALSSEEKALYEAIRQQAMENVADTETPGERRMKILVEIMRLRRTCCHPRLVMPDSPIASSKLEVFAGILNDLRANNHKALVFSQFVGHLALVREYLDKQAIEYQYLDGSTPSKKRQQAVNNFQAGEGDLFLISLKAGGSGLNLTAADYVIHLDPWWNPAVEDQASDRAHRIGQQRPVTIYRLVAEDTIEEKIVSMHHQKRDLADSLLEGTEMSGKLSVEDILTLLKEN